MSQEQLKQATLTQPSLFKRAQEMAEGRTESELGQIARNICATKGIDFDKAWEQFNKMWNMK